MTDIEKRCGTCVIEENRQGQAILTGQAPVAAMRGYQAEVMSYTRGQGRLACALKGYEPCHNSRKLSGRPADPERYGKSHGIRVLRPWGRICGSWDQVKEYMHVDSGLNRILMGRRWRVRGILFPAGILGNPLPDRKNPQRYGWVRMKLTRYWSAPFMPTAGINQRKGYPGKSRGSRSAAAYSAR